MFENFNLLQKLEDCIDLYDAKIALKEAKKKGTLSLKKFAKQIKQTYLSTNPTPPPPQSSA